MKPTFENTEQKIPVKHIEQVFNFYIRKSGVENFFTGFMLVLCTIVMCGLGVLIYLMSY